MTVSYTFATEIHDCVHTLCIVDVNGVSKIIATFIHRKAMMDFKETLNLAKMSAHASGQSGI